jgi:acetylornithine deacetylase/succinyl-diaminopimelate desuccinylase-like protein
MACSQWLARLGCVTLVLALVADVRPALAAPQLSSNEQLARDVYRELVEIDTVTATGDTARAANAMAARLHAAGFGDADVEVFIPAPTKGNLVARLRGSGARRPILLLAHLDVVPAKREDWSMDPFVLVEKDGWFYGRGTSDDKAMAAAWVANLIRYRREGYVPERDIVVVLSTDEEISDSKELGITWLLKHHRGLLDAELALNEGGEIAYRNGTPISVNVQTSEKAPTGFLLEVKNPGGHASVPRRENAIYRLAAGLTRLAAFEFPLHLTETTRQWLERAAAAEDPSVAADMRAVAARGDAAAAARLSTRPFFNAQLRTTCVATMLTAGHASNALPQTAQARLNCRLLPGERVDDVAATLVRVIADDQISITSTWREAGENVASPVDPRVMSVIERLSAEYWPGVPVAPKMETGATDGRFLRGAGIPTYGHSGFRADIDDIREHGKDERMSVASFYQGTEYLHRFVRLLAGSAETSSATRAAPR